MAALLSHQRVASKEEVDALITQYTHTCGYVRAWADPHDPFLIWFLPQCPADAVSTALVAAMPGIVRQAYLNQVVPSDPTFDPRVQVLAVIAGARTLAITWLNKHTTEDISLFVQDGERLRDLIIAELVAQGAIT